MKKVFLLAIVAGLMGCKDHKIGLDKNVINTAYTDCFSSLEDVTKSPKSLQINSVSAGSFVPTSSYVYDKIGGDLVGSGKIENLDKKANLGFRVLSVSINYDAQNSYGVYLRGGFECQYLYETSTAGDSPKLITLVSIKTNDDEVGPNRPLSDFSKFSNIKLNSLISKRFGVPGEVSERDAGILKEIVEHHKAATNKLKAQEIQNRVSQESLDAAADATAAAKAAVDVAADADAVAQSILDAEIAEAVADANAAVAAAR